MAKVYSSQNGIMRGRVGNTIYRKGQNATIAAQYQPQVANPRSPMQQIQRCAFATATAAASALKFIANHSHEGVSGDRENIQKFVRQNVALIKANINAEVNGDDNVVGIYNIKGVSGIQANPFLLATGTLAYPVLAAEDISDDSDMGKGIDMQKLFGDAALTPDSLATADAYNAWLSEIGLVGGDQLSVVFLVGTGVTSGAYGGSVDVYENEALHVSAARVTFKRADEIDFTTPVQPFGGGGAAGGLNPAIVARYEGNLVVRPNDEENLSHGVIGTTDLANGHVRAAAIVRSQMDLNGKYNYSRSQFATDKTGGHVSGVLESYSNVTTYPDGSSRFLDNPEGPTAGV